MNDESQLQVQTNSSLILSTPRSGLIARGRRDAALLAVPCDKCGECKELVFTGRVCASCSDALDKQWGSSAATDWLLTALVATTNRTSLWEYMLLNSTYAQVKTCWAADGLLPWFWRTRQPTFEELAKSKTAEGTERLRSTRDRTIRPATPEEIAAYKQIHREWEIATETDKLIRDVCEQLGIREQVYWGQETREQNRLSQAAKKIARRLRQHGWIEELAKMKREDSDALQVVDNARMLEMALNVADGSPHF